MRRPKRIGVAENHVARRIGMGMTTTWVLILVAVVSDSITAPPETIILPFETQHECIDRARSFAKTGEGFRLRQDPICIEGLRFKIEGR
jgi:hypothetical protein